MLDKDYEDRGIIMDKNTKKVKVKQLTKDNFKLYGEVITGEGEYKIINQGNGKKWNNLVNFDMFEDGGKVNLGLLRTKYLKPVFNQMERHHYTSQIFISSGRGKSLVAVAPVSDKYPDSEKVEVFLMEEGQGISFNRKVWHHSLFPLNNEQDYILIMRGGNFALDVELVAFEDNVSIEIIFK